MRLQIRDVNQGASGGSYVCIFEADVDVHQAGGVSVTVRSVEPANSPADLIADAVDAIRQGAEDALRPRSMGASLTITRLVIHEIDFKAGRFRTSTTRELGRLLGADHPPPLDRTVPMQSVKLILVLIIVGVALLVGAFMPADTHDPAASATLGSWVMGLIGAVCGFAGLALLRRGYSAARKAQGGAPLTTSAKVFLTGSGVAALAALAFIATELHRSPPSTQPARVPGVMTKADYIAQEQQEIKRRQDNDKPAPAPAPKVPDLGLK